MNRIRAFSFFEPKHFPSISRFLVIALMKGKCQRYQRDALNCKRAFLFFGQKFFSLISISGGRKGER